MISGMKTTKHKTCDRSDRLGHYLLKALNKGQRRYGLLADGDTILLAVSGGKDSLTMLELLERRRRTGQERYSLVAAHIVSDYHCGRKVPDDWLATHCQTRGIPLVMESVAIAENIAVADQSHCYLCARERRRALFEIAGRMGCNKLAFGHHADDVAETTLMNLFYSGRIDTIDPKATFFDGRLTVIRPLILIEERDIVPFAQASGFPLSGEPCPDGTNSPGPLSRICCARSNAIIMGSSAPCIMPWIAIVMPWRASAATRNRSESGGAAR
jgi:tRNA 2-thiocytidine biosynthesis protein TtcA